MRLTAQVQCKKRPRVKMTIAKASVVDSEAVYLLSWKQFYNLCDEICDLRFLPAASLIHP